MKAHVIFNTQDMRRLRARWRGKAGFPIASDWLCRRDRGVTPVPIIFDVAFVLGILVAAEFASYILNPACRPVSTGATISGSASLFRVGSARTSCAEIHSFGYRRHDIGVVNG